MSDILDFLEKSKEYTEEMFFFLLFVLSANLLNWIILGKRLHFLGIYPRRLLGLVGIVFAPFLHGSFNHFISNALPFFCLELILIFILGLQEAISLSILLSFCTGFLTWCFGRAAFHIGASGVVSSFFGWIVYWSFYNPSPLSFFIVFFVLLYFGTIFIGIFPTSDGSSWESHLLGLISGLFLAKNPQYSEIFYIFFYNFIDYHGIY